MIGTLAWCAAPVLGGLGALGRFHLDTRVQRASGSRFPTGTLVVNLTGAFLLGILVGSAAGGRMTLLLGTALLGSYTTFSTWMFETHRLAEDREGALAVINLLLSLQLGFLVAWLGMRLGSLL